MAKKPTSEQTETLKNTLKKFPISYEKKEWSLIADLQATLKKLQLLPLIKGQIKASLEGKKSPSLLCRLRALWTLAELQLPKSGNAAIFWNNHLIKASEWVALKFSTLEGIDKKVRFQLEPEQTHYGYEISFFLKGCSPQELLKCQDPAKIGSLPWTRTASYLPQHFTWGSSQGPLIYLPYPATWKVAQGIVVRPTEGGWDLFPILNGEVHPKKMNDTPAELSGKDDKLPGGFKGENTHFWTQTLTPLIPHRNQILSERLFAVLVEYIDELLGQIPSPPLDSLEIDPVTLEGYPHPLFGKDHTVGARRVYRPKAQSLSSVIKPDPETPSNMILPTEVDNLQMQKIAFLDLVCANLLRQFGHIHMEGHRLHPVRNGFGFARYAGTSGLKNSFFYQDWHSTKAVQQTWGGTWEGLIQAYEGHEMAKRAKEETDRLNQQFPSAEFRWTPMHELVVRGADALLKSGLYLGATPYHLSWYQAGKYYPAPNSEQVLVGQEFWFVLGACLDIVGENWKKCTKFPEEIVGPLGQMTNVVLHKDAVMHSIVPEVLQIRLNVGHRLFFRNVLQGSFDKPNTPSDASD